MRAVRTYGFLLAALFAPTSAFAQGAEPAEPSQASSPEPAQPSPPPPSRPEAESPAPSEASPAEPPNTPADTTAASPVSSAPQTGETSPTRLDTGARGRPVSDDEGQPSFARRFRAWPLSLEARFGFNARLGSSFEAAAHEEVLDTSVALAGFLAWNPEYALGIELDHVGLGRVRALSDRNSIDAEYSATGAWLGARVFPVRRERLDVFVNLRVGLALQHVSARGIRADSGSITVPAVSFSCSEWAGPGFGFGGSIGIAYRITRRFAVLARLDATGSRLGGDALGTCADGIGSVASVNGTVGLAYEFETAPK